MTDCDVVLDIRNDLQEKMKECREVTEKYRTGRSAYLRLSQLLMRLFAGLLQEKGVRDILVSIDSPGMYKVK